ncbi:ABC transporter ATP-binding protein [Lactobacillus sp. ESL0791]|uniref:ABC transporter ATP-binding protein n=1 Tax=Lactobacillus sp. ESL0791 TaxID=2983234 RepID=UPI0023F94443|nr:ABC transporter ATP-binding protein [Lactobacillus sp. ESL0791]MDF7638445.1 ABC transporter ATP-binding protein [Lactobacillus sp. ESL0791]
MTIKKYLLQNWQGNLFAAVCVILRSLSEVLAGFASANAITKLVSHNLPGFGKWLLIQIILLLIFCLGIFAELYFGKKAMQRMDTMIRTDIASNISQLSYSDFHRKNPADFESWLTNDIQIINQQGFQNLLDIISGVSGFIFAISGLMYYHYSLVILTLILTVIMTILPKLFNKAIEQKSLAQSKALERSMNLFTDAINGFDDLLLLNLEKRIVKKIHQGSKDIELYANKYNQVDGCMTATINAYSTFCQIAIIGLTGILYLAKLVPVGSIMATQTCAGSVFAGITGITISYIDYKAINPLFKKFNTIKVKDAHNNKIVVSSFKHDIQIKNLSFHYLEGSDILKDINFTIEKNKKYAIIGPSGSGKTTLSKLLTGSITSYRGQILFDGIDLQKIAPEALRNLMVIISQNPFIFNGTIKENILLGRFFSDKRLTQVIEQAGLSEFIAALPNGIDTVISKSGNNLSGGQKQRIAMARGMISGANIIIMDEGTSALDKKKARKIEKNLVSNPSLTVLMITHHLSDSTRSKLDGILQI